MKRLLPIVLFALIALPLSAQAPVTKSVEYNISLCDQRGVGIFHSVLSVKDGKETLSFLYYASDEDESKMLKDTDPLIFNITSDKTDKAGRELDGEANHNGLDIKLAAFTLDDRIVAAVKHDDYLSATVYGRIGGIEKSFDDIDEKEEFCHEQMSGTSVEALKYLANWLITGDYPESPDTTHQAKFLKLKDGWDD